jgi:hypothetical protein
MIVTPRTARRPYRSSSDRKSMRPISLSSIRLALVALPLLSTLPAMPARASLVEAMDLSALTAAAQRIVVGEVLSASSAWDTEHKRIYTTVMVQVAETWKGPAVGTLKIVQLGGSVGDIEMRVHGLPAFRAGERAVMFLGDEGALVGLGQGKRPLRFDTAARRWVVDGGDRTAAFVAGPRGEIRPAGGEASLPLDELRTRVRKLVAR